MSLSVLLVTDPAALHHHTLKCYGNRKMTIVIIVIPDITILATVISRRPLNGQSELRQKYRICIFHLIHIKWLANRFPRGDSNKIERRTLPESLASRNSDVAFEAGSISWISPQRCIVMH
ncbi:hypothetical protein OCU04_001659 [Sclerotinia nivalis]|uniref:Uncharacterized protein n=1 Tax=Sclerotinia nivalis TaxID=352851 RepID=A0A9X0AYK9_9HELO|nr:hypothetical protein OCU04_001659 [Sclerotinia nivalis]